MASNVLLLERDHSSLTVGWIAVPRSGAYELEMKEEDVNEWRSLSSTISKNTIRKKNLLPGKKYIFRVRAKVGGSWEPVFGAESDPLSVVAESVKQLTTAPTLLTRDTISVTVTWGAVAGATGYQVRYRIEDSPHWEYVSSVVTSNVVKKKNLQADKVYCFSVKPIVPTEEYEYGPSSTAFTVATLSRHFKSIFPSSLKTNTRNGLGDTPTADAIAGKVVAIYFSAHWCGPCRQFTPQLSQMYQQAKSKKKDFEIVFCSADHSEEDFESYYKDHMPWLAVPYDDDSREAITGMYKVSGIPRLVVLSPSGKILVDNAVGQPLSIETVDSWIAMSK